MILQVGLGVETVEQVAVEVVEAKATDEDLELLTGYGRPERTNHISGKIFRVMHAEKLAASGSSSAKNENRSENLRGFR